MSKMHERYKRELDRQRHWIEECGGDQDGYIANYHGTHGRSIENAIDIYNADCEEFQRIEKLLELPSILNLTGQKIDDGQTVTPDHYTQRFTVVIRSLQSIPEDDLKDQIQKKWEVVTCRSSSLIFALPCPIESNNKLHEG